MDLKRLFGSFSKVEELGDGTVIASGIASTETRDSDKEMVRADGMRKALAGYMKFANVREMHQAIAAGTAQACFVDDAGVTHIAAHVVDANSVKKVLAKVLKGFSIGGTVLKRNEQDPSIIEELDLKEISLVDRPANPDAMIELVKFDKPAEPLPVVVGTATIAAPIVETPIVVKAAKRVLTDEIRKGLYSVGYLAETISQLNCIAQDATFEADYEGDDSPIPARLKASVNELCAILRDMAAEETAELTGDGDVLAMAAKPGALKKSEKFAALCKAFVAAAKGEPVAKAAQPQPQISVSSDDLDAILRKALAVMPAPVLPPDAEALAKRAADAEAAKAAAEKSAADAIAKATAVEKSAADALAKVAGIEAEKAAAEEATKLAGAALQKVMGERDELTKALAKANVELATKGVLRVVAVEKGADGRTAAVDSEQLGAVELTKAIHASGGRRLA